MKMTMMIIGTLLVLSSCNCMKVKNDIRHVWSYRKQECRCQWYSFKNIKEVTKLIPCEQLYEPMRGQDYYISKCEDGEFRKTYPEYCAVLPQEEYCDNLVGFKYTSWGNNITPHAKETKRCAQDKGCN